MRSAAGNCKRNAPFNPLWHVTRLGKVTSTGHLVAPARIRPKPRNYLNSKSLQSHENVGTMHSRKAIQGHGSKIRVEKNGPIKRVPVDGERCDGDYSCDHRVKLPQLPCCAEESSEMPCAGSRTYWLKSNSPAPEPSMSVSGIQETLFEQFQRRQFRGCEFDEFDEIQNHLNAICFAKPEILTSTLTLAALNCPAELKRDPAKKRANIHTSCITRGPLMFEKVFDICSDLVPTAVNPKMTNILQLNQKNLPQIQVKDKSRNNRRICQIKITENNSDTTEKSFEKSLDIPRSRASEVTKGVKAVVSPLFANDSLEYLLEEECGPSQFESLDFSFSMKFL